MLGRILPLIVLILPFWLVRVLCKTRDMLEVWPGLLACGVTFGSIQFFWSNYMGPSLVDILGGIGTLLLLAFFFRKVWSPREDLALHRRSRRRPAQPTDPLTPGAILSAWSPFLLLAAFVVVWGYAPVRQGARFGS